MAHLDVSKLTQSATVLGSRALEAHREPAVQKAGTKALRDIATAANSVSNYVTELGAAWRRLDAGETGGLGGLLA